MLRSSVDMIVLSPCTVSELRTTPKLTLLLEVIENLKHSLRLLTEFSPFFLK